MIDTIIKALAGDVSGDLTSKAGISQDKLGELLKITNKVATKEVVQQAASGGLGDLMNLFSNKPNNQKADLIQNGIVDGLVKNFSTKLGLSPQQSAMAAGLVVPALLKLVTKKNNETPETDPGPLQQIFEMTSGKGKPGGALLGGLLGKLFK